MEKVLFRSKNVIANKDYRKNTIEFSGQCNTDWPEVDWAVGGSEPASSTNRDIYKEQ